MELWPPIKYRSAGRAADVPEEVLSEALSQAHRLQRQGRPAILTLKHLAVRTDTRYEDLRAYVERREDPYRVFQIRKRSGGKRTICVPNGPLLRLQRWLARYLLNGVTPHSASVAYAPKSSPVRCARFHCGCRWLVKIDIRSFFESISEIQVFRIFNNLGYNPLIAFEMARLCTRVYDRTRRWDVHVWTAQGPYFRGIARYASRQIGHLPQGAPTSPMLANLAMVNVDADIMTLAENDGLAYTRYADDLIFSTDDDTFSRKKVQRFIGKVNARLRAEGLLPNPLKTTVAPPGARKIVLGLLVDGDQPRLTHEFKSRLLLHAYYLRKYGPANHAQKRGFRSILSMRRHIEGLLAYARDADPLFATKAEATLSKVDWGTIQ